MSQLAIIDQAMSVLSTAEAALETNLERLNPVAQRALRAKAASKGEKTEHLVAAIGPAVGAAKSLLAAV